jgi:tRNA(Ile)-lysidine synthase
MRTRLEQRVLETIRHAQMLLAGDRVGVAVSGGADSVALLRILSRLRCELGILLCVVHFDHSLRGEQSEGDARFVSELAQEAGLEFFLEKEDVAGHAAHNGWNLEDAGRRMRYAFFHRLVKENRLTKVAVAHTADDQAETVLAHIIRGTGPTGLGAIYPARGTSHLLERKRSILARGFDKRRYAEAQSAHSKNVAPATREQLLATDCRSPE